MLKGYGGLLIFGVLLGGLFVCAFILQAACVLYNKLAGISALDTDEPNSEDADRTGRIPPLSLGQAVGIIFVTAIVNGLVGLLIDKFLNGARIIAGGASWTPSPVACLVMVPLGILIIGAMVPTRFGKGLLVALLYTLLWFVLGIVLFALFFVVSLVLGGLHLMG